MGLPAQYLGASMLTMVQVPIAEHVAYATLRSKGFAFRPMRMTMNQAVDPCGTHPLSGGSFIHICPRCLGLGLLMSLTGSTHLARLSEARLQRRSQEGSLPSRLTHLRTKAQVVGISQTQFVTVDEQRTLTPCGENRRVGEDVRGTICQHVTAQQKVAVANHDAKVAPLAKVSQHARAGLLIRLMAHVIAHPSLEQVTQDEDRIS